jgi:glycerophosphoryl diester phosphodiesterase/endonuclease/exonuclease/phosphatase family metal-dependent hydrolase
MISHVLEMAFMNTLLLTWSLLLPMTPSAEPTIEITAHRGASFDAPENTLASVNLGWKQRADSVEVDVFLSKDGKIVVCHDSNLKRLAGVDRRINELTLEELQALDVGKWKDEKFAGEKMPTLAQVLETIPEGKRLFIEVKTGPEIVEELDRVLKAGKRKPEQTAIISFSSDVIASMKKTRPDLQCYWIVALATRKDSSPPTAESLIEKAKSIKADGLDLSATPTVLTAEFAKAIKAAGLKLFVWTVNDVSVAKQLISVGVEGITTDRPEWLRERLAESPKNLRLMSYNIRYATAPDADNRWENRRDHLLVTILNFSPDLIGTQETLAVQRDFLRDRLIGFEVHGVGRDDGKEEGEMMAIFYRKSRFEKLESGHFWLSETPDTTGSKSWDSSLPRMVSWLKLKDLLDPEAKPILYLNTHFDHRGPKARLEGAKLIRQKLAELGKDCRLLLTGDFNCPEGSEPYRTIFGGSDEEKKASPLQDTFRVAYPSQGDKEGTTTSFKVGPLRGSRIDWIGASKEWQVLGGGIDYTARNGKVASDHFAVFAVLNPAK